MPKIIIKIFFLLIFLVVFIFSCKSGKEEKKIKLNNIKSQDEVKLLNIDEKNQIRIAIAPVLSPQASIFMYNELIKFIEKKSGYKMVIIQSANYSNTNELLKNGLCDIAFICTGAYMQLKNQNIEILAIPVINGECNYYSYIITNKDSNIKSFIELENKKFSFTDPLSLSGFLYVKYLLKLNNKNIRTFFSKTIFTYSHDNSIMAVIQDLVDGAAVDSLVYNKLLNDRLAGIEKVKIIHKSTPFGISPVVIRGDMDKEFIKILRKIFLNIHNDDEGKIILRNIGIDRFIFTNDDIYSNLKWINELNK
jgi:phosphonate transport system substrate-binding protein